MEYRNRVTEQVFNYQELLVAHPNTYIPPQPTAEYMDGLKYDIVQEVVPEPKPFVDYIRNGIELTDGIWYQVWQEQPWQQDRIDEFIREERMNMIEIIKTERDARVNGGVFVNGNWFHSDTPSRIQWLGIKDTARDMLAAGGTVNDKIKLGGRDLMWKTMSGDFVPVTIQLALDVVQANKELDAAVFTRAEEHRTLVNASLEPGKYNYLSGWPARYGDTDE